MDNAHCAVTIYNGAKIQPITFYRNMRKNFKSQQSKALQFIYSDKRPVHSPTSVASVKI